MWTLYVSPWCISCSHTRARSSCLSTQLLLVSRLRGVCFATPVVYQARLICWAETGVQSAKRRENARSMLSWETIHVCTQRMALAQSLVACFQEVLWELLRGASLIMALGRAGLIFLGNLSGRGKERECYGVGKGFPLPGSFDLRLAIAKGFPLPGSFNLRLAIGILSGQSTPKRNPVRRILS